MPQVGPRSEHGAGLRDRGRRRLLGARDREGGQVVGFKRSACPSRASRASPGGPRPRATSVCGRRGVGGSHSSPMTTSSLPAIPRRAAVPRRPRLCGRDRFRVMPLDDHFGARVSHSYNDASIPRRLLLERETAPQTLRDRLRLLGQLPDAATEAGETTTLRRPAPRSSGARRWTQSAAGTNSPCVPRTRS